MELPKEYSEKLIPLLDHGRNINGSLNATMSDPNAVLSVLNYATLPISKVHDWECDLDVFKFQLQKQKCMFSEDQFYKLLEVYKILYPDFTDELDKKKLARSFWMYKGCKFSGEHLGSTARSSLVKAAWLQW